jgi:hypothetical protein
MRVHSPLADFGLYYTNFPFSVSHFVGNSVMSMASEHLHLLPLDFPASIPEAKFQVGDRVCWQPCPTQDFGTITGLEYAPTFLPGVWRWKYTIWLDLGSPSRAWTLRDTAWEGDLEPISALSPTPFKWEVA